MKFSKQTLDNVQGVDIVQLAGDLGFQGRQVLVYPDRDAHEEWAAILATMRDLATFCISDILHDFPMEKGDIADFVLMRNLSINNLFDDKDQDNAWHKEKCSCNYISHRVARECWGVEKNNGR